MKYRLKHLLEYAALRGVVGVVSRLPYRVALALGAGLAVPAWIVMWRRVREAERRVTEVFGAEWSPRAVRRIVFRALVRLGFMVVEMARLPRINDRWLARFTEGTSGAVERLRAHAATGRGAIVCIPHMGNWDLAGVTAARLGLPVFFLVGRQRNPLVDAYLNRLRGSSGAETIPRDAPALKPVIKNLRAGKMLAFMTDLRSKTPGVTVRFLGKDANVVAGLGFFARQADVPIFPVIARRRGWAHHAWDVFEPIEPDPALTREVDWARMTQRVMDIFSAAVRAAPHEYFWFNKRWIFDPLEPATDAAPPKPSA